MDELVDGGNLELEELGYRVNEVDGMVKRWCWCFFLFSDVEIEELIELFKLFLIFEYIEKLNNVFEGSYDFFIKEI